MCAKSPGIERNKFRHRKNFSFNGFTTIFITKLQIFFIGTCQDLLHSMPGLFAHMDKTFCIPCQDFVHPLPGFLRPLVNFGKIPEKNRAGIALGNGKFPEIENDLRDSRTGKNGHFWEKIVGNFRFEKRKKIFPQP